MDKSARIIEHRSNDLRVVAGGRELRHFDSRHRAESYLRGWQQLDKRRKRK